MILIHFKPTLKLINHNYTVSHTDLESIISVAAATKILPTLFMFQLLIQCILSRIMNLVTITLTMVTCCVALSLPYQEIDIEGENMKTFAAFVPLTFKTKIP